ncbi:MAG: hydantoinase B/oxoprolinase family protein, partial [Halobacteriaceae archaeon]
TDPDIPPNHGCYRPIEIEAPTGTLVNPNPPAAVVGGNLETSQRITDVVLGAFAQQIPERVMAAGQGTMNNITFGGTDPRDESQYAFYETQAGGFGGRHGKDGMDAVHVHMSNTLNTPIEVLETAYPLRVKKYALREDSGGAGEYRGGLGIRRDIEVRNHQATFSILADRFTNTPYGLAGGNPGTAGEAYLLNDSKISLPPKTSKDLSSGDVISIRTPGGGGYGNPDQRDPEAIQRDLQTEKFSEDFVQTHYSLDDELVTEKE